MPFEGMQQCKQLLERCKRQGDAAYFFLPVALDLYSDYFEIVKTPMDFGTVDFKLGSDAYSGVTEFIGDMRLVFSNAVLYNNNRPTKFVAKAAKDISRVFEKNVKDLMAFDVEEEEEEEIVIDSGFCKPSEPDSTAPVNADDMEKVVDENLAVFTDDTIIANVSSRTRSSLIRVSSQISQYYDDVESHAVDAGTEGNSLAADTSINNDDFSSDGGNNNEKDDDILVCPLLSTASRVKFQEFFSDANLSPFQPFLDEVDPAVHGDYRLIVTNPVSLRTIENKLQCSEIDNFATLAALVRRVAINGIWYNSQKGGKRIRDIAIQLIERFEACAKKIVGESSASKKKRNRRKVSAVENNFLLPPTSMQCISVIDNLLSQFDKVTKEPYMDSFMPPLRSFFAGQLPDNYCRIVYGNASLDINPPCVGSALCKLFERGIDGTCHKDSWKSDVTVFERQIRETFENCIKYWTTVDLHPETVASAKYMLNYFNSLFSEKVVKWLGVTAAEEKVVKSQLALAPVLESHKKPKPIHASLPKRNHAPSSRKRKIDIAGDFGDDDGSEYASTIISNGKNVHNLKEALQSIMFELEQHRMGDGMVITCRPFAKAVDPLWYPNYYEIISMPMDLSLIGKGIRSGKYEIDSLVSDMLLIRDNAFEFNPDNAEGVEIRLMCSAMLNYFRFLMKPLVNRARSLFIPLSSKTDQFMSNEPVDWPATIEFANCRKYGNNLVLNALKSWNVYVNDESLSNVDGKSEDGDLFNMDDGVSEFAEIEESKPQYVTSMPFSVVHARQTSRKRPKNGEAMPEDLPVITRYTSMGYERTNVPEWEDRAQDILTIIGKHELVDFRRIGVVNWFDSAIELANQASRDEYLALVSNPMEFRTLMLQLGDGKLIDAVEFCNKLLLIFQNAVTYNSTKDDDYARRVVRQAQHLLNYCKWVCLESLDLTKDGDGMNLSLQARDESRTLRIEMINDVCIVDPNFPCLNLISKFTAKGDKDLYPFLYPVDTRLVPNYTIFVLIPMDFETLKKKVDREPGYTYSMFMDDAKLIFENGITFNSKFPNDPFSKIVLEQSERLKQILAVYLDNVFSVEAADFVCLRNIEDLEMKKLTKEEEQELELANTQLTKDTYAKLAANQSNMAQRNEISRLEAAGRATGDSYNQFKVDMSESLVPDEVDNDEFGDNDDDDDYVDDRGRSRSKRKLKNKKSSEPSKSTAVVSDSSSWSTEGPRVKLSLEKMGEDLRKERIAIARSIIQEQAMEGKLYKQLGCLDLNFVNPSSLLFRVPGLLSRPVAMNVEMEPVAKAPRDFKLKNKQWGAILVDENCGDDFAQKERQVLNHYSSPTRTVAATEKKFVLPDKVAHNPTCSLLDLYKRRIKHEFQSVRCESDVRNCLQEANQLRKTGFGCVSFIFIPLSWKMLTMSRAEVSETLKMNIRMLAKYQNGGTPDAKSNAKDSNQIFDPRKMQSISMLSQIVCTQRICLADDVLSLCDFSSTSTGQEYDCLLTTILLPQSLFYDLTSENTQNNKQPANLDASVFSVDDAVILQSPQIARILQRENAGSSPKLRRKSSDASDLMGINVNGVNPEESDTFVLASTRIGNFVIHRRTGSNHSTQIKPPELNRHSSWGRARSDSFGSSTPMSSLFGDKSEVAGAEYVRWKSNPLSLLLDQNSSVSGNHGLMHFRGPGNSRPHKDRFRAVGFEQLFNGNVFVRKMSKRCEITGYVQRMMIAMPETWSATSARQYVSIEIVEFLTVDSRTDIVSQEHLKQLGCVCGLCKPQAYGSASNLYVASPLQCCEITLENTDLDSCYERVISLPLPSNLPASG